MSDTTATYLDVIPSIAAELPALVAGEPTTVDRLMLAAGVCGWITDMSPVDDDPNQWCRWLDDTHQGPVYVSVYAPTTSEEQGMLSVYIPNNSMGVALTGLSSTDLADIGRAFLNAAIATRATEEDTDD